MLHHSRSISVSHLKHYHNCGTAILRCPNETDCPSSDQARQQATNSNTTITTLHHKHLPLSPGDAHTNQIAPPQIRPASKPCHPDFSFLSQPPPLQHLRVQLSQSLAHAPNAAQVRHSCRSRWRKHSSAGACTAVAVVGACSQRCTGEA